MGNRAVPVEIKRRRGTLRQDRIPGELVPVAAASLTTPPPPSLRAAGRAEWERTLRTCTWIATSDLNALQVQCELIDRRDIILAELFGTKHMDGTPISLLLETSTGYAYSNPLLISLLKVEDQLAKWTSLLGKTPSDRSRLGVAEVKQASKLDELAQRRLEREAGVHDAETPVKSPRRVVSTPTAGPID